VTQQFTCVLPSFPPLQHATKDDTRVRSHTQTNRVSITHWAPGHSTKYF